MKLLYIVNIGKRINNFSESAMVASIQAGIEFHIAGNYSEYKKSEKQREIDERKYGIKIHQIDFIRNPFDPRNVIAYNQVVKLIEKEKYDSIHCNTPIGGVVGRLAGKRCGVNTIIYQAHGFHFYKGAPLINWALYYPIEKYLARYTDILITINKEDYEFAKEKMKLKERGQVKYIPGVGIHLQGEVEEKVVRQCVRTKLKILDTDFVLISMGDLIERKNYYTVLKAIAKLSDSSIHYIICGDGNQLKELQQLSKDCGISRQIHFLGYRSDIVDLLKSADVFVNSSIQEGLPRSTMEAMAFGLPVVCSRIRGNTDLIIDGKGGILCEAKKENEYMVAIKKLSENADLRRRMGRFNLVEIEKYRFDTVVSSFKKLYSELCNKGVSN